MVDSLPRNAYSKFVNLLAISKHTYNQGSFAYCFSRESTNDISTLTSFLFLLHAFLLSAWWSSPWASVVTYQSHWMEASALRWRGPGSNGSPFDSTLRPSLRPNRRWFISTKPALFTLRPSTRTARSTFISSTPAKVRSESGSICVERSMRMKL